MRFSPVSSAYLVQSPELSEIWQSMQFKLSEAAKKPMVAMNSSTEIPLSTWTFLKTSSAIRGFAAVVTCAVADTAAPMTTTLKNKFRIFRLRGLFIIEQVLQVTARDCGSPRYSA